MVSVTTTQLRLLSVNVARVAAQPEDGRISDMIDESEYKLRKMASQMFYKNTVILGSVTTSNIVFCGLAEFLAYW